jgi:hypothetical protein
MINSIDLPRVLDRGLITDQSNGLRNGFCRVIVACRKV